MSLIAMLAASSQRYPGKVAMWSGTEPAYSYLEFYQGALSLGAALRRRLDPGARVAIVTANTPEYPRLMFGIWAAGMVAVPINAKLHPREIAEIIADSGAGLVLTAESSEQPIGAPTVTIGGEDYDTMLGEAPIDPVEVAPEELAWLFFTSGTTGRSKGAMLTHRNLLAMSIAHLADFEDISVDDCLIHGAPMSHGSGLYMLPYTMRGASHVVPGSGGFDPGEFIDLLDHHLGCGAFLAPTMLRRLRLETERRNRRPRHVRRLIYGGGPMYLDEIERALDVFGPVLTQLYGQGEAPMTITGLRHDEHDRGDPATLGSVGWPRSGVEVRVVGQDGKPCVTGEAGEITCRGDVVMAGYWGLPVATAQTLRGGWLFTGDVGSLDERGRLTLRDRSKDVIISGGSNIYPREVEEALLSHAAIEEVAVVGEVDPDWGETVVAFVVVGPNGRPTDAQLEAHCLSRIARFKRPKRYIFVPALPKNSYGKVVKRELAAMLTEGTLQ